ncbi:MAG: MFS transporter [Candidatus Obscuribacter sp.]|nr:MFS transporter [Candidatus Obscuribacter sp.]MBL0189635.1 MFS transporter [Candidatus Obscuribacter sp.]
MNQFTMDKFGAQSDLESEQRLLVLRPPVYSGGHLGEGFTITLAEDFLVPTSELEAKKKQDLDEEVRLLREERLLRKRMRKIEHKAAQRVAKQTSQELSNKSSASRTASAHSRQVLTATWLGEMFDGMDASIYVLVMHQCLSELLGSSAATTVAPVGAVVLSIFIAGWVVGGISCGILADYFGRTRIMLATILIYAFASGLCALSHNWMELAFYRFLVGFGIGGEIGIGAVMVAETFKGRSRMHAASFLASSFSCGYLVAAAANLWLGHLGWRWLFLLGVAPAIVTLIFRTRLHEPEHFVKAQLDRRLQVLINKTNDKAKRSGLFGALRGASWLDNFTLPQIFGRDNLAKTLSGIGLSTPAIVGYWAVLAWMPAWVTQLVGGTAVQERSVAALVMNVGGLIGSLIGGWLICKIGYARSFRLANLCAFIACVLLFGTVKEYGASLLSIVFFVGFFAQMLFALLFVYIPELYAARIRCTGVTTSITGGRIFAAIAALLSGQLVAALGGSYAHAAELIASVYLIGVAVSFVMPKHSGEVSV